MAQPLTISEGNAPTKGREISSLNIYSCGIFRLGKALNLLDLTL